MNFITVMKGESLPFEQIRTMSWDMTISTAGIVLQDWLRLLLMFAIEFVAITSPAKLE
jgi:hypothetical protein